MTTLRIKLSNLRDGEWLALGMGLVLLVIALYPVGR